MNAIGIIFANLHERNIPELTRSRTVGSVPFGCRYRLIDFTLSNMVNSGITDIRVVTQYSVSAASDVTHSQKTDLNFFHSFILSSVSLDAFIYIFY